ncbi:MAG TPA: hypothetical protein PLN68_08790, partial [Elusimicrobiales bacterium]|nr:hypothetical protein [Elusimicrobiales bacterium]
KINKIIKMLSILLLIIASMFKFALAGDFYLTEQILNKVLRGNSINGYYNTDQVFNLVFNSTANAFNVWLDTTSPNLPFILKTGGTMTGDLTIDKSSGNGSILNLKNNDRTFSINNNYNGLIFTALDTKMTISSGLTISTSIAGTSGLCLIGASDSLPTSGYSEGCIIYNLTDHNLYISTENVVGIESWKSIW